METNLPNWVRPYSKLGRHIHSSRFRGHLCKKGFQIFRLFHFVTEYDSKVRCHIIWHPKLFILGYIEEWYNGNPFGVDGIDWEINHCMLNFELRYPDNKDNHTISSPYYWTPYQTFHPYSFDEILERVRKEGATFVEPTEPMIPEYIIGCDLNEKQPELISKLPKYLHKYIYGLKPIPVSTPKVKTQPQKQSAVDMLKNNSYRLLSKRLH